MTSKDLDKEKTKEDVIAIKNLRLEILERENQKLESEHQALLYDKNLALSLLQTEITEYNKLVEKVKELVLHYFEFEMYGKNYNAIFKTIIELKEMIGYEDD